MLGNTKLTLNNLTLGKKLTLLLLIIFLVGIILSGIALANILPDRALLISAIGILIAVFVFTVSIVNFGLQRWVVRPIKRMIRVAEAIAAGDTKAEFKPLSKDEVGRLAVALMRMKRSLLLAIDRCEPKRTSERTTQALVRELSKGDFNWMMENGRQQQVVSGRILTESQSNADNFYIILDGILDGTLSASCSGDREIGRFCEGEVLGELSCLHIGPSAATVQAVENSIVLALPPQALLTKLQRDLGFASRFYRAIAILLLDRFERSIEVFIREEDLEIPPLNNVSSIFSGLNDSDVEWIIERGQVETIPQNTVLIQAGCPIETFYVLLEGSVSVGFSKPRGSALGRVFESSQNQFQNQFQNSSEYESDRSELLGTEIYRSSKGEILGEMALIDSHLPSYTFKALENSQVLAIDTQQLFIQLQQNPSMGNRFYRAIAMLYSRRLQRLIDRQEYSQADLQQERRVSQDFESDGNLDLEIMNNITLDGARFNWMLKRLKLKHEK